MFKIPFLYYRRIGVSLEDSSISNTCNSAMVTDVLNKNALVGHLSGLFVNIRSINVDLKGFDLFGHVGLVIN